jgi:hypothetical protein
VAVNVPASRMFPLGTGEGPLVNSDRLQPVAQANKSSDIKMAGF